MNDELYERYFLEEEQIEVAIAKFKGTNGIFSLLDQVKQESHRLYDLTKMNIQFYLIFFQYIINSKMTDKCVDLREIYEACFLKWFDKEFLAGKPIGSEKFVPCKF